MILLIFILLAGCAAPKLMLDTQVCDPKKEMCFAVSVDFLEKHFFIDEQNQMLKDNLKHCREKL